MLQISGLGGGEWRDRGPMKGGGATKGGEDNADRDGGVYYYLPY